MNELLDCIRQGHRRSTKNPEQCWSCGVSLPDEVEKMYEERLLEEIASLKEENTRLKATSFHCEQCSSLIPYLGVCAPCQKAKSKVTLTTQQVVAYLKRQMVYRKNVTSVRNDRKTSKVVISSILSGAPGTAHAKAIEGAFANSPWLVVRLGSVVNIGLKP